MKKQINNNSGIGIAHLSEISRVSRCGLAPADRNHMWIPH